MARQGEERLSGDFRPLAFISRPRLDSKSRVNREIYARFCEGFGVQLPGPTRHSILSPWAGRLKQLLLVKYDPRNLSRVYVRDPNGRHWPVPYANLGQPPVALWELEEARKELRKEGGRALAEKTIFASIAEQRRIVNDAARSSKQRRRQEKTPADSPVDRQSVDVRDAPKGDAAEIKPYPVEIWEAD